MQFIGLQTDKLQFEASNKSIMIYRYYTPSRGFCQVGLYKYKKRPPKQPLFRINYSPFLVNLPKVPILM